MQAESGKPGRARGSWRRHTSSLICSTNRNGTAAQESQGDTLGKGGQKTKVQCREEKEVRMRKSQKVTGVGAGRGAVREASRKVSFEEGPTKGGTFQ